MRYIKTRVPGNRMVKHRHAMCRINQIVRSLVSRNGTGDKENPIQFILLKSILSQHEMPHMYGVEGSSKNPNIPLYFCTHQKSPADSIGCPIGGIVDGKTRTLQQDKVAGI